MGIRISIKKYVLKLIDKHKGNNNEKDGYYRTTEKKLKIGKKNIKKSRHDFLYYQHEYG